MVPTVVGIKPGRLLLYVNGVLVNVQLWSENYQEWIV